MKRTANIHGLYGIADAAACNGDPVHGASQLLAGGCRIVQLRCKGWSLNDIEQAGRAIRDLCLPHAATFILNDHPHLVESVGAHGVHIGQEDPHPSVVRAQLGPQAIIGWTTNDPQHLHHIPSEIDYLAYGPIWSSKRAGSHKTTQGFEAFLHARKIMPPDLPLVAIGGIRADKIPVVRNAGASAWAVIGAVFDAEDPVEATRTLVMV